MVGGFRLEIEKGKRILRSFSTNSSSGPSSLNPLNLVFPLKTTILLPDWDSQCSVPVTR